MPVFEFAPKGIRPLSRTTFSAMKLHERRDLQPLLRENIAVIAHDTLVIAEEFGWWDNSLRRIDLLGIDRDANLVVVELKRTEDGGHMELQAIRYAAMVSTLTFDQAVSAFEEHRRRIGAPDTDARSDMLDFLGWDEPDHDNFAQEVKIVLASAEFSKELTTAVLWLNQHDLDIRCVRLQPYDFEGRVLVDVQQIIPPPEAADYQVRVREKVRREREARSSGADHTRFDLTLGTVTYPDEPKRWVILHTFRYLVQCGLSPEDIASRCGPRSNRALLSVDGEFSGLEFIERATQVRAASGKAFDPIRWFCRDGELIHFGGQTYAFSSQWGGSDWLTAMNGLREAFADKGISFAPSGSSGAAELV